MFDVAFIMVGLDEKIWTELTHAYGRAGDIPDLLRALRKAPEPTNAAKSEPWFTLWSSLCHQDEVYDASYAALPHIVEIACQASGPIDFSFFQLPAAIEISRNNGRGPNVPLKLAEAYYAGVANMMDAVALHRHDEWDDAVLLSAVCAQAVAKGRHRIAEAIMNLDDDLIAKLIELDF